MRKKKKKKKKKIPLKCIEIRRMISEMKYARDGHCCQ
jgi:hypothetical protein